MFRGLIFSGLSDIITRQTERYPSGRRVRTRNAVASASWARVRIPFSPPNKHRDFDTKSRCTFYIQKLVFSRISRLFQFFCPDRSFLCQGIFFLRLLGRQSPPFLSCDLSAYRVKYGANVRSIWLSCEHRRVDKKYENQHFIVDFYGNQYYNYNGI